MPRCGIASRIWATWRDFSPAIEGDGALDMSLTTTLSTRSAAQSGAICFDIFQGGSTQCERYLPYGV